MNNKELEALEAKLKVAKKFYEEAALNAANYNGQNQKTEDIRDARMMDALNSLNEIRNKISEIRNNNGS